MRQHQRHIRWRDPADAAGLSQRDWADAAELFAGLGAKVADSGEVESVRDTLFSQPLLPRYLLLLAVNVAFVFHIVGDLQRCLSANRRQLRLDGDQLTP